MRGSDTTGRFRAKYELMSMYEGIAEDLQNPVGQFVHWYVWSPRTSNVDPVYDVGDYDGGRTWAEPFVLPVVLATIRQGTQYQNERGFYTTDELTLVVNADEMYRSLPTMASSPDNHLKDRIVYRDSVFDPTLIYPKGHIRDQFVVVRVDANEVKPDQLIHDPQFYAYHQKSAQRHRGMAKREHFPST